ncbi:MAG: quinolinate synthase NadA [Phycisphaerae bacterium]|nr:quinolinate synthase NadA [Phycisphaerae bacterium]
MNAKIKGKMLTADDIPPTLDLRAEITRLRKELNAVILAHYYQESEIQDIADFLGDSLKLAQVAQKTNAEYIVFCGVHFMAETAKILNPTKKVVVPDLEAGCSLADSCPAEALKAFRDKYPDHVVVTYINCTAAAKAVSDIICTSSNAAKIIESIPKDKPIIFAPDKYLGSYLKKLTGRDMKLWNGACEVHEQFSAKRIAELSIRHPDAKIIAHPECDGGVLSLAHFIGSTEKLLNFVRTDGNKKYIVATEPGIIHQMKKAAPGKDFIEAPSNNAECPCNVCPYMKKNTVEKLYLCMANRAPEVVLPEEIRLKALIPLQRMLEI